MSSAANNEKKRKFKNLRTEEQNLEEYYINAPIDPETGLPKLPETYFFRVKKSGEHIRVEIWKKIQRKFLWWPYEGERDTGHWSCFEKSIADKSELFRTAKFAYYSFMSARHPANNFEELLGDYPPKNINA